MGGGEVACFHWESWEYAGGGDRTCLHVFWQGHSVTDLIWHLKVLKVLQFPLGINEQKICINGVQRSKGTTEKAYISFLN